MEDVKKCGYLRKQKSMRKRFFVLRSPGSRGPARLEYYENEKKFRMAEGSGGLRGTINLEETFGVNKRADAKRRHLLVMYTRDGGLGVSADGEDEQEDWYKAILEVQAQARNLSSSPDSAAWPGPAFREVWQVSLRPRGLGQTRNLSGIYRLCLTERTLSLLRLRSENPSVTLQLMNVRRCGHSDNYFFVEVGRSAVTGPGELWMQVEDSVVAQNMHETILEAMKSLSEEFRPRTKSQSLSSTPITVPSRRHHPNPPPPSQVGFSRRSRTEATLESSPAPKSNSVPRDHSTQSPDEEEEKRPRVENNEPTADYGSVSSDEYESSPSLFEPPAFLPPSPVVGETNYISMVHYGKKSQVVDPPPPPPTTTGSAEEVGGRVAHFEEEDNYAMMGRCEQRQETGYMPMLPGSRSQDYMPMTPNSISPPAPLELAGYVMMSPLGSCSPEQERVSWPPSGDISAGSSDSHASDYMNMWPLSRSASSTPPPETCLTSGAGLSRVPASYRSLPRSYKMEPVQPARASCSSSSDSLEEVSGARSRRPLSISVDTWRAGTLPGNYRRPPSPGEYVSIHFRAPQKKSSAKKMDFPPPEYIAMERPPSSVHNGDYTDMDFGPGRSFQPQVKISSGSSMENALRPSTEKVPVPTLEKASTDKDIWPLTTEKAFWPVTSAEMVLCPNAKLAAGPPIESNLGLGEKVSTDRPVVEDGDLKGLAASVSGCSLHKGQDRAKPVKSDPPPRLRRSSDTPRQGPAASCNGTPRPPEVEPGLNYIDLDLAKETGSSVPTNTQVGSAVIQPAKIGSLGATTNINPYASIDFQMSGELRRGSRDGTEC
ncbi:insulin receptor substrate 1-like [Rhinophrynus dorsalis]